MIHASLGHLIHSMTVGISVAVAIHVLESGPW